MSAICALYRALLSFLKANGKRIISISETIGQRSVKIELHGLRRHFKKCCGYNRLSEVMEELGMEGDGIEMSVDEIKAIVSMIDEMGLEKAFLLLCNEVNANKSGMKVEEQQESKYILNNSLGGTQSKNP